MTESGKILRRHLEHHISIFAVFSGLLLVPLLPIGVWIGTTSLFYRGVFVAHLAFLLWGVGLTLWYVWGLKSNAWAPIVITSLLFLTVIIVEGLAPVTARDALIHHLAVPKWWLEEQMIFPIGWHEWSFYPMLLNLAYVGLLGLNLEQFTSLYHLLYLILLGGVSSAFVHYKTKQPALASLTFLCTISLPLCVRLASSPLVDLGLALFSAIAAFSAVYWIEKRDTLFLYLAGLSLGLALSCKYNGLLFAPLFLSTLLAYGVRAGQTFRRSVWGVMVVSAVATIVFAPWLIKNLAWTGNPVYPLYRGLFGGAIPLPFAAPGGFNPLEQRIYMYGESWVQVLLLPIRIFLQGEDGNPMLFDGMLTPLLLFSLLTLIKARRDPALLALNLLSWSYILFSLLLSGARVRYLAPVLGPLTACSIISFALITPYVVRVLVPALVSVAHISLSACYCVVMLRNSDALSQLFHPLPKQEYLARHLLEYPMIEYINQHVEPSAKVWLLFTANRFYYFERAVQSSGHNSGVAVLLWIYTYSTAEGIANGLREQGVTYLMAHADRTRSTLQEILSDEQKAVWNDFHNQHLELVHSEQGYVLWRIHCKRSRGITN